jgi:hypothetical protein
MLNRDNVENKSLNVKRVTKLIDERRGDPPSARIEKGGTQVEIAEIVALTEAGDATACLIRFNGRHPVTLPAEMIAGLNVTLGMRLKLRVKVPEFAGFRGNTQGWHAISIIEVEDQ